MFFRKLCVIFVPLLLLTLLCIFLPMIGGIGFLGNVLKGTLFGVVLGLVLPLSGASRRREPFAGLLWLPTLAAVLVIVYQYLSVGGTHVPVLQLLETGDGQVVWMESAFAGFLLVECFRTSGRS